MDFAVVASVFPLIFLGELPDKTMFASLVLATRGRPLAVWTGAAGAFAVHAALGVTVGATLGRLLPERGVNVLVAFVFAASAVYAYLSSLKVGSQELEVPPQASSAKQAVGIAFVVIFVAEFGDLTQILIFNLAAKYHSSISVATGSALALWTVAALAVGAGRGLLEVVSIRTTRRITAAVLVILTLVFAVRAALG